MRTVKDSTDLATLFLNQPGYLFMHGFKIVEIKLASRQAGLVSRYHHGKARLRQTCDGLNAALDRHTLIHRLYKIRPIKIDHTITIKDYQFHAISQYVELAAQRRNPTRVLKT